MIGLRRRYRVGSRIVANVDIEIVPWDAEDGVTAGDHGEVIDVDPETDDLTIVMDRLIPALVGRRNYLYVSTQHLGQIEPEIEQRRSPLKRATLALSSVGAAAVALVISGMSLAAYYEMVPIFDVQEARLISNVIASGEPLVLTDNFIQNRQCPLKSDRIVKRANGMVVWHQRTDSARSGSVGKWESLSWMVQIPALPSGEYTYSATVSATCNSIDTTIREFPPTAFWVVNNNLQ